MSETAVVSAVAVAQYDLLQVWIDYFTPVMVIRFVMLFAFWATVFVVAIKAHKARNDFDLLDLVIENGRGSKWNVIILVTFGLSCVFMSGWFMNQSLEWGTFFTFCGIWVTPLIAKMFIPVDSRGDAK